MQTLAQIKREGRCIISKIDGSKTLVRRLAELMDYPLTLRSRLARGTMFRVRVPLTLGARQGADAAAIASAGRDGAQSAASASAT